jgi:CRP-like cAMP-binding protein
MPVSNHRWVPLHSRLLAALPAEEYGRLWPALELVDVFAKQVLYKSYEPITHIYFPQSCVVSLLTITQDKAAIEVATVGREGMVGIPVYLGSDRAPVQAVCQIPGVALRMETGAFRERVNSGSRLHGMLQAYTLALLTEIAQTATCNRIHSVEQRCGRCLLMNREHVGMDALPLTQEFLSQMLGVRRATVTGAAGALQRAGWIRYRRGRISIVDRDGLEAAGCECYRAIKGEFDRLLGTP